MPRRKTHEEYIEDVYHKRGNEYQILSTYEGMKKQVTVLHTVCGTTYETRADGVLIGYRCKTCLYKTLTKPHEEYVKQVNDRHGNEYEVVSEYTGAHNAVDILHKTCGRIRTVDANSVLQGKTCAYCYNESKIKTHDEFVDEVYDLVGDEYEVVSPYVTSVEPIEMIHKSDDCNLTFTTTPNSFLSGGNRCPNCAFSRGEDNIRKILEKHNIAYTREKEYEDLVNVRPLRFDFHLPDYNLLIEFDGLQHFKPIPYFGGEEYFKYIQENDKKKNDYCKDNGIHLLRIPYNEINNEEGIILSYIEQLNINSLAERLTVKLTKDQELT